ncbi:MAG: carboxylating nicotinate-nucleotide diphosphorylase [Ignavibacteriae bacterium]|nr:carboxylating nicotinate-nucleotide diphosphorylase [Ignavibacteriota bacterium]
MDYYKYFNFWSAEKIIKQAIKEDVGKGDATSNLFINRNSVSKAELLLKEKGIVAGLEVFKFVFSLIDKDIKIKCLAKEGIPLKKGTILAKLQGNTRNLLLGERVALNILQRMSGIASSVHYLTTKLNNKTIKVIDTRKTTPNFRLFEKLAVKIGGGGNHRFGLYDMILIKDNHIEANGGIENVLKKIRKIRKKTELKIEIEVKNLEELKIILDSGKGLVDIVMLDNFSVKDLRKAILMNKQSFRLEISGGVDKSNISKYSKIIGVDYISTGSVTHSVKSIDIALNFIT